MKDNMGINKLSLLAAGMALALVGCQTTHQSTVENSFLDISTVIRSPGTYDNQIIAVKAKVIFNGYIFLTAINAADPSNGDYIEVPIDQAKSYLREEQIIDLEGSCAAVVGKFTRGRGHGLRVAGVLNPTKLELLSICPVGEKLSGTIEPHP